MTIDSLIDKQDNFEIVRDQIAAILVSEVAAQMVLASAAAKNPDDWKLRIFSERSNPWEQWLNDQSDTSPIVNIWFDNTSYDEKSSNVMERQTTNGIYNIDCYGFGLSADVPAGGHTPGDREAAFEAQRAFRLVRNILMSDQYVYLGLRGLVGQRWPQAGTSFQPQLDGRAMQQIFATRFALRVSFNEFAPQITPEALEFLSIDVLRTEDGEIVLEADYDYTATQLFTVISPVGGFENFITSDGKTFLVKEV